MKDTNLKITAVFKMLENGGLTISLDTSGGLGGLAVTYKGMEFTDDAPALAFYHFIGALNAIVLQQGVQRRALREGLVLRGLDDENDIRPYPAFRSGDGINIESSEGE